MGFLDRIAGRFDGLVSGGGAAQARVQEDLERGRALVEGDDLDGAAAAFGRAVDGDASSVDAWLGLAQTLARLQRFEPARDAYRRALALPLSAEQRPHAQAALGRLYARAEQLGKAIRELRKAAAALPDDRETLTELGRALIRAGESEGGEWLARAARLTDGDPRLLLEAAAAKVKSDAPAALRLLEEAAARAPADATVRATLARHLARSGAAAAARAEATRATGLAEGDPETWAALREVHAAAGEYLAAFEAARQEAARGRDPAFAVWLSLALGAEQRSAIEESMHHGSERDPGFPEARGLLAGALSDAGLMVLAGLAPGPSARRFIVRALAPAPVPAGNLYALLAWAEGLAAQQPMWLPLAVSMARAREALDRPLLVAVMGEFNAGKSSFVNALAGAAVAPVGVTPTTATINILRFGDGGGRAIYHDGHARDLPPSGVGPFLSGLDDRAAETIRQVEIFAPVEALRRVEIVDTPGLNALRAAHEKVARDFLLDADAIVWVFAAGQAAKASERDALTLAHAAGKRVLGVINKVERASADEISALVRHVEAELGGLVERVAPLSARAALAARLSGDTAAVEASGLPAVEAALESGFFAHARELKRATALLALNRFIAEARAALPTAGPESPPPAPFPAADHFASAAPPPPRAPLGVAEQALRSVLAAERVSLRARLDAAFRAAAVEVRDFVRPRGWLFGEHTADPEDETFLRDLLDDGAVAATAKTRTALRAAVAEASAAGAAAQPAAELTAAIDDAVERFLAYSRGIIEGAAAVFFRVDLPRIRLDLAAIYNALGRWSPDPEESLFRPLERAIDAFVNKAAAELDGQERTGEIAAVMRREHLVAPLDALTEAVAQLERTPSEADATP